MATVIGDRQVAAYLITDHTYLVRFAGELVESSVRALSMILCRLVDEGAREIVVDLTDVTTVDSTALEHLVAIGRKASSARAAITVACADHNVVRLFELVGLKRLLSVQPTVTDAFTQVATRARPSIDRAA